MRVRIPGLLLFAAALAILAPHASAGGVVPINSRLTRMRCCEAPENLTCRTALERWHACEKMIKSGKVSKICGESGNWRDMSLIACRPGIDGPPDWKDKDKPEDMTSVSPKKKKKK